MELDLFKEKIISNAKKLIEARLESRINEVYEQLKNVENINATGYELNLDIKLDLKFRNYQE